MACYYTKHSAIGQQAVDHSLQNLLMSIPWGHHTLILTKVKNPKEAVFYIVKTIEARA